MADPRDETPDGAQGSPRAMDPVFFAAQYQQAYPRLHLIAAGITGDRTFANDIVQDAAVIALEKSDQFIEGTNFAAWLAEIVRRCSLNYVSKVRGRRTAAADPDLLAQTAEDESIVPTSWPISGETGELIGDQSDFDDDMMRALAELTADARCCLLLRIIQKLSYADISNLMKIPQGTAMSHVHRSKRQLRQTLARRTAQTNVANDAQ